MSAATPPTNPASNPDLGIEVPVCDIDQELRKLWEQDDARTNASLMNLVVYSEETNSLSRNSKIISKLTQEHACRAILVEINRAVSEPAIRAWITAHCHLAHGRKSVCCEQIAFYLTGTVTGRFRNTVFAHLNSDLPLVFWWQGELSEVLTERLAATMDRLIVDSSNWKNPAESFRKLANILPPSLVLQDHAWSRTWQFRLGVASVFDDPIAQQALPKIDQVNISYHSGHKNSALQLLAWLAIQANWTDQHYMTEFQYAHPSGQSIVVKLTEDDSGPALTSLELKSKDVTAQIKHQAGSSHVERHIHAGDYHAHSMSPADPDKPEELVASQLSRAGSNALFKRIITRFRAMIEIHEA